MVGLAAREKCLVALVSIAARSLEVGKEERHLAGAEPFLSVDADTELFLQQRRPRSVATSADQDLNQFCCCQRIASASPDKTARVKPMPATRSRMSSSIRATPMAWRIRPVMSASPNAWRSQAATDSDSARTSKRTANGTYSAKFCCTRIRRRSSSSPPSPSATFVRCRRRMTATERRTKRPARRLA
jgi:hypothetical protein